MFENMNSLSKRNVTDAVLLAKRLLIDNIYSQANLEGIAITFANTNDIINNINVDSITPNDISKILCLRDGWEFILNSIEQDLSLVMIEELHSLVARFDVPYYYLGKPRQDVVRISGTDWVPEIPNIEEVYNYIELNKYATSVEDCMIVGLYFMRTQLFKDGNKRIGSFIINKLLIMNGLGIFKIPVKLDTEFKMKLIEYYETNDCSTLVKFLIENCFISI